MAIYNQILAAIKPTAATPVDPSFSSVNLLLHGDGTNGSTTFTDSSNNHYTVSRTGNTSISTAQSKFGGSSILFGAGNAISYNGVTITGSSNYTLESWLYLTGASASGYTITFGGAGSSQLGIIYADGRVQNYNNGATGTSAAGKMVFNQWAHFAVVRNGGVVKIYVNGTDAGIAVADTNTTYVSTIGGYSSGPTTYNVIGYMDEVRVTNGVARYTANFSVPTAAFPNS